MSIYVLHMLSTYLHMCYHLCIHFHQRKGWIPMMKRWQQGSAGEGPRATFGTQGTRGPGDGKTSPEGGLQGICLSSYFGKI